MGFLKCKSCGETYQLKPGESPEDFERCECGGKLEYFEDENGTISAGYSSNRIILRIGIFIVALFVVYMLVGRLFGGILEVMANYGPAWGAILLPLFIIGGIVLIIALIWYGWKK